MTADQLAAQVLSVNVGLPKDVLWQGRTVHTAVWKDPVDGPRLVRRLNIDGDGQGDLAGHGGEQRAVFVYQIESYRYWQDYLSRDDFTYGQFGENLTVQGLTDDEVCIGDRYRIGSAVFEVSQPRVTCYRVGIRMDDARMPALLISHHRPGFYFRVLREGIVQAGDEIVLSPADRGDDRGRCRRAALSAWALSPSGLPRPADPRLVARLENVFRGDTQPGSRARRHR